MGYVRVLNPDQILLDEDEDDVRLGFRGSHGVDVGSFDALAFDISPVLGHLDIARLTMGTVLEDANLVLGT